MTLPKRTNPQRLILDSDKRFNIAAWGRQSGKTTSGGWKLIKKPLAARMNGIYWHVLQTHTAAEVAFNRYVALFPRVSWSYMWAKRPNESEKTVYLTGHRAIHFKSGENYQDLRSETLDGAIIDECRQQHKELWPQIIRAMLARRGGWCDFYSTPMGYDWFYDLAQSAKLNPKEFGMFHAPSTEAWWWTPEEIESARATMTEAEFAQEIMAEFRDLVAGRAYPSFGDHNLADTCPWTSGKLWAPYSPIILGMDFNLSPMHWTLGQTNNLRWWWFDEVHLVNSHTLEAAFELRDKILLMKAAGFNPNPNVIICGDATGNATQRTSNQSDYDIVKQVLKSAGITFRDDTPPSNPGVKDRVNAVNVKCKNALGESSMWFHRTNVPKTVHDMQRVTWKPGADFILNSGSDKMLTHASDSIGYPVYAITPVKGVGGVGKQRVINRIL